MSLVRQPDQVTVEPIPTSRFGPGLRRAVRLPDHLTPEPPVLRALVREPDQKPSDLRMLDLRVAPDRRRLARPTVQRGRRE